MKFWQRLRLIGSVVVLAISVLAILLAMLHTPNADTNRPLRSPEQLPGPTGL
jgi:hypothetical protein